MYSCTKQGCEHCVCLRLTGEKKPIKCGNEICSDQRYEYIYNTSTPLFKHTPLCDVDAAREFFIDLLLIAADFTVCELELRENSLSSSVSPTLWG